MTIFSKQISTIVGVGAAVVIVATTWQLYNKRKNTIPEKWSEVGVVSDLWIYPLKSGRAVEIEEAQCTESGPVFIEDNKFTLKDRGLLVNVEKNGEQRTARNYPQMVLITVSAISKHEIKLEAPDASPLIINTSIKSPELVSCSLFYGEPQQCIDCGNTAAEWISQYCLKKDFGLRLGLCAGYKRSLNQGPWKPAITDIYENLKSEDLGIYTDIATYLIFNKASMEDLNKRLPTDVSILNFRPNIVVDGPEAYEEDKWKWIKIGEDVIFRNVKPCTRCTMVNIDPETGIPLPQQVVLKKLQEYRLVTNKKQLKVEGTSPVMGIYAGLRKSGRIQLGDKVYVG